MAGPMSPALIFQHFLNAEKIAKQKIDKAESSKILNSIICEICESNFESDEELEQHIASIHEEENPFKCNICGICFISKTSLNEHISNVHERRKSLQIINITKDFQEDLSKAQKPNENKTLNLSSSEPHLNKHTANSNKIANTHKIEITKKQDTGSTNSSRTQNQKMQENNENQEDMITTRHDKNKPSDSNFLKSQFDNHIEDNHKMKDGLNTKITEKQQISDKNTPKTQKTLKCDICKQSFESDETLKQHIASIHEEFKCNLCKISFVSMTDLHKHISENHGQVKLTPKIAEAQKPFKCEKCNLSFEIAEWKKHITEAHKKKKIFELDNKLTKKRKISEGESSGLSKSSKSETSKASSESLLFNGSIQERKYPCLNCNFVLSSKSSLKRHLAEVHKMNENFQLKSKNVKTIKIAEHDLSEKNISFENDKNESKIESDGGLDQHMKPKNLFKCLICDTRFDSKSSLNNHITNEHGKSETSTLKLAEQDLSEKTISFENDIYKSNSELDSDLNHQSGSKSPLKCLICGVQFSSKSSLNNHIANEHGSKETSTLKPVLIRLMKSTESEPPKTNTSFELISESSRRQKPFKCESCNLSFDKSGWDKHIIDVHDSEIREVNDTEPPKTKISFEMISESSRTQKPFKCESCNLNFDKSGWNKHIIDVHDSEIKETNDTEPTKLFKCPVCDSKFNSDEGLKKHTTSTHQSHSTFRCGLCDISFISKPGLDIHNNKVHNQRKTIKSETTKSSLKTGDNIIEDITTTYEIFDDFECGICSTCFSSESKLNRHIKEIHEEKENVKCPKCRLTFASNDPLEKHIMSVHNKPKEPIVCKICGKSFKRKTNLEGHISTVHEGKKPFKCELCDAKYTTNFQLNKHIDSIHEPQKVGYIPSKCEVCGKKFKSNDALDTHVSRVHDGVKPFECSLCNTRFSSESYIKRHMAEVHENSDPFQCNICGVNIKRKANLKAHILNHTLKEKFKQQNGQ